MSKEEEKSSLGDFFGNLSLGVVFRHFLSGAVFVFSYLYAKHQVLHGKGFEFISKQAAIVGVASLIFGALIYAVHRSLVNPVFEFLRHYVLKLGECKCARSFFMPEKVMKMMFKRWQHGESVKPQACHIYEWGDYVHLLYTAGLAAWFGSVVAYWTELDRTGWDWNGKIITVGFVFAASGFYTDCRKHVVEDELYRKTQGS